MQNVEKSISENTLDNQIIKLLLEHTTLGIVICDSSEHILDTNSFITEILGLEKTKILSHKLSSFFEIKDENSSSKFYSLSDLFSQSDAPFSKVVNLNVKKNQQESLAIQSHIYTRILGEDFYLVCLFNDYSRKKEIDKIIEKYGTFSCYKDQALNLETFQCEAIKELVESISLLAKEANKTAHLKKEVEQALEREKQHGEFKTRFVSIASHELRTPLGGILTSASLLEKYNSDGYVQERKKHIDIIKGQIGMLTSILNDFLSFDRLDRPEVRINLKMFSLSDFFKDFISSFAEYPGLHERIEYKSLGKDRLIYQDPDLLFKVVNNIVSNGLKYSKAPSKVQITSEVKDKNIEITVKDYGIGIPDGEKKFVWDLFYRCENTSGIQGTGLGLNIAHLCSNLMEGKIFFESKANLGTEFTIQFPKGSNL